MPDRYEPYQPPSGGDGEPQWPLLPVDDEPERATSSASTSSSSYPSVYPPGEYRRTAPVRPRASGGAAVAGIVAVVAIAVGVGSYSAAQPDEPDYRDQWEQCLSEESGDGGLLEPEELCAIQYPNGEEDFGDLGYDNEDPLAYYDDDGYPEDEFP